MSYWDNEQWQPQEDFEKAKEAEGESETWFGIQFFTPLCWLGLFDFNLFIEDGSPPLD